MRREDELITDHQASLGSTSGRLASFTMLCSTAPPEPLQESPSPAHVNRLRPLGSGRSAPPLPFPPLPRPPPPAVLLVHAKYAARNGSSSGRTARPLDKLLVAGACMVDGRPGGGGTDSRRAGACAFLGVASVMSRPSAAAVVLGSHEKTTATGAGAAPSSWPMASKSFLPLCTRAKTLAN
ncbi:hypothetical protein ACP70R_045488 [Stipagrostis hirtigluma subsp. patula]